jgi:small subunit ribosomal protein S12
MATTNQLLRNPRKRSKRRTRRLALTRCPQRHGICMRAFIMTPRKPNSAKRKVVRVLLPKGGIYLTAFIPGIGHNLQKFSKVLVRGGRVNDLPGMKYQVIRGKYDLKGVVGRRTSMSKYGQKLIR